MLGLEQLNVKRLLLNQLQKLLPYLRILQPKKRYV